MGIDAEEYFGTADVAEALERECEEITMRNQEEDYDDNEPIIKRIHWNDIYRMESVKKDGIEYFILINQKTNEPYDKQFKTEYDAIIYAERKIYSRQK